MFLGQKYMNETVYFYAQTRGVTGPKAADSAPTYRVYEDDGNSGTAIDNGTMTALDATNTVGRYYATITLDQASSKYEAGKDYVIDIRATVDGVSGAHGHMFSIPHMPYQQGECDGSLATTGWTSIADYGMSSSDDAYNNMMVAFTSGTLAGLARVVTDYTGSTRTIVCEAFPAAPSAGDQFILIGKGA